MSHFTGRVIIHPDQDNRSILPLQPQVVVPFQYLAYTDLPSTEYQWVPGDARVIPAGAVIGGKSPDGYPLYIILDHQPGNYDPRNRSAEVNYHDYVTVDVWRWLVLVYGMYVQTHRPV